MQRKSGREDRPPTGPLLEVHAAVHGTHEPGHNEQAQPGALGATRGFLTATMEFREQPVPVGWSDPGPAIQHVQDGLAPFLAEYDLDG